MTVQFQSTNTQRGEQYRQDCLTQVKSLYKNKDVQIVTEYRPKECPSLGIDIAVLEDNELIEAIECKAGELKKELRPRTDCVKKAIGDAACLHQLFPAVRHILYCQKAPKPGNLADELLKLAVQYGLISEVRYFTAA